MYGAVIGLPYIRTLGRGGNCATIGAVACFSSPRYIAALPFTATATGGTLLVADFGNNRAIEVDVVTGFLVRVWSTSPTLSVAASANMVAISNYNTIALYNAVDRTVMRTITIAGSTPNGMRFSMDGSYLVVADQTNNVVSKWFTNNGSLVVSARQLDAVDVEECISGSTGAPGWIAVNVAQDALFAFVDGSKTIYQPGFSDPFGVTIVPGVGVVTAEIANSQILLFTSPQLTTPFIITAPLLNGTVAVGGSINLTVTTTGVSTGFTYRWKRGTTTVGTNSPTLTLTAAAADVGAKWIVSVEVSHAQGSFRSSNATIIVVSR